MSPLPSIAMLPIHRESELGENVPCWKMLHGPVVLRSSYQRTPAWPERLTVWFISNDSRVPKLRYSKRYIGRSAIASSHPEYPPGSSTQLIPVANAAVVRLSRSVKVEFAGVVQSAWKA